MGLGLFLFGLVFAHAASPEATSRHIGAGSGVVAADPVVGVAHAADVPAVAGDASAVAEAPGSHRHDHPQSHTVEECALGQPPQGPDVDLPCLSPLGAAWQAVVPVPAGAQRVAGRDFVVPIAHAADSTILRI
ncbi:hypothetical protein ABZ921_03070 [Streptomyces atriruber]|uniref:Secreted protein n=1 Tax=Streptomyces atriruber TaxID=545121 RepID=A0ABV3BF01_9ACTN